ncbi:adenosylcobinamide-GDP ribazoletransferase [Siminovitchia sp. FSL H7-0308]|uniref:Adenosylcobinamide-GDP ribazoletransferase n=1 Tax=Siminovitchia thermophila TaxID=1245522 RepID=A0ABS2R808_9BACI|nr:adenosylcobinamide-GDP ribazoletransferase [Siminovitchia thermophila]MBM7715796.1 adenosylcobinamide-GDP ribazoletransferase [Siminovitchia thermophila]ONK23605.1 adenosylcobinamide-GDP ribazoletransferase [Bacillus sp. VT-16-64]
MRSYWFGFLIALQFFSTIPIRKEIPMTSVYVERAVRFLPFLGMLQGLVYSGCLYMLLEWSPFSDLAVSFMIWFLMIVVTGGIHLDGWIDSSDAYFSYRDRVKRLEIMVDPRVGAFGVISIIVLLAAKFLFIYEIVQKAEDVTYLWIMLIPALGKMVAGLMLLFVPAAKNDGLAHFFQQACRRQTGWVYPIYLLVFLWNTEALLMIIAAILLFVMWKKVAKTAFGGITGDIVGAATEGTEAGLWMIVWLLHYYAMG